MPPSSVLPQPERARPGFVFRVQDPPQLSNGSTDPSASASASAGSTAKPLFNLSQSLAIGARAHLATTSPPPMSNPGSVSGQPTFTFAGLDNGSPAPLTRLSPAPESPASSLFTTPSRSPFASPSPEPQGTATKGNSFFGSGVATLGGPSLFASSSPGASTGTKGKSPFGTAAVTTGPFNSSLFGSLSPNATKTDSLFGNATGVLTGSSLFTSSGTSTSQSTGTKTKSLFGNEAPITGTSGSSLFGSPLPSAPKGGSLFGTAAKASNSTSSFGTSSPNTAKGESLFGSAAVPPRKTSGSFLLNAPSTSASASQKAKGSQNGNLFGRASTSNNTQSVFEPKPKAQPASQKSSLFNAPSGSLFQPSPAPSGSDSSLTGQMRTMSLNSAAPSPLSPAPQTSGPYNVSEEQPPPHEFFTFAVQQALTAGRGIALNIKNALDDVRPRSLADEDSNRLRDEALKLSLWKATGSCKIAVLGDSGQGKSSLINSLLHVPGLAQTSDMGSACTSVVTEYHQRQNGQFSPIAIEVEYVSGAALEELVKELAWSYRQFYLPDVPSASGLTTDEDYAKYQRESDQAWFALESAFQHHQGFSADFLQDQSEGAQDRVNARLIHWARKIKWPAGHSTTPSGSSVWRSVAGGADECCEKTKVFMQDGLWPFTKIIRVYLSSQVLNGGVVLADLPGLQDTNLARVKTTQEYLLKCDNILIVSKISRAITDHSLKSSLFSVVARHVPTEWEENGGKKLNLAVVCTGTEEIDAKKATAEFCGQGKRISKEAMSQLEADIEAAKASGDHKKKKNAKRKLEFALISARNAHVKEALQKRYSKDTGGTLEVFCIANKAYEKFSRKGNADFVKESGIPDLRRFCHSIIADTQMREARHFQCSLLPGLLNSVDLWASSHLRHGAFDEIDRSNMEQHLANIQEQAPKYVKNLRISFMECFQEQILGFLGHREGIWKDAAVKESQEWNKWRYSRDSANYRGNLKADEDMSDTYQAWCRRNGKHSTGGRSADWNASIVWKMRMELEFQWDIVEDEIPEIFKTLSDNISKEFTWLKEVSILQASQTVQRDLLIQAIHNLDDTWKYNINLKQQELARGVTHIRKQSSESNETSFVFKEMLQTYRAAASQSGQGTDRRQKAIVNGQISGESLFPNMAVRMSGGMEVLASETERSVGDLVKGVMEKLEQHIRLALREGRNTGVANNSVMELKKAVDNQRNRLAGVPMV